MKNTVKKSLSVAMGATLVAAMSASPAANADESPFGMQSLKSGYTLVAENEDHDEGKAKEAKCGEGKCGEGKMNKMKKEGKCGEGKMNMEGKCGEGKAKAETEEKEGGAE